MFARRYDIQRVSLDVDDLVSVVLPLENLTGATALDFDSSTDLIYWTDIIHKTIYVATTLVSRYVYKVTLPRRCRGCMYIYRCESLRFCLSSPV